MTNPTHEISADAGGGAQVVGPDDGAPPDHIMSAAQSDYDERLAPRPARPGWVDRFVWTSLWKVVAVGVGAGLLFLMATRASDLLRSLVVSLFFALALIPAVNYIHGKWGWRRGAAVGLVYAGAVVFVVLMVVVLIPGITQFADQVQANSDDWIAQINDLGQRVTGENLIDANAGKQDTDAAANALAEWGDDLLGFATSGVAFLFNLLTIAMFTFYMAADYPGIQRAVMSRMPPKRQQVVGWVADQSIEQTGGYFYSRMLLMIINGSLSFLVMLLVGLPVGFALPLAVFMGFFSEFIPAVGTYIGGAIPIMVTLALQGIGSALLLLLWVVIYQQIENLFLSPRLSAKTMEVNGAVAFGAALAGGAIAGPMGAFMALPVAALITAVVKNSGKTYAVVYHSRYGEDEESGTTNGTAVSAAAHR